MPLSHHSAHHTWSFVPRQGTQQQCQHSDPATLSPVLGGGQKLSPLAHSYSLYSPSNLSSYLLDPTLRAWDATTCSPFPGAWVDPALNPQVPNMLTCLIWNAELFLNSLFSSPWKRELEGNSPLRQHWASCRGITQQRWALEAEQCVWKAWEHFCLPPCCSFSSLLTKITVVR